MKQWFQDTVILIFCASMILLPWIPASAENENAADTRHRSGSGFPIVMYDSDIGFGFGGRGVVKNLMKKNESFDMILFASTLGEQWYVFTFSIPDFEIRQGTRYPAACDIKLEFDKFLKSNFFGFGNDSEDNDFQFPKEFIKLEMTFSRALTEKVIGEAGWFFNHTSIYGYRYIYDDMNVEPVMHQDIPGSGARITSYVTARLRWDTRDSQIHPRKGIKLALNADFAGKALGGDYNFSRYRLEFSAYLSFWNRNHVLAARVWGQHIEGTAPYYEQSVIGGGDTGRGFKKDRFIDDAMCLVSLEYRCIITRKLGGILFADTGRVYPGINYFDFSAWKTSTGWGLRYYLENFVVRFDMGISREGTRLFFNFGHVF